MRRELIVSGIVGLTLSAAIFLVACLGASSFPALIQNGIIVGVIFVFLLGLSLVELPIMLYGLRLMARHQTKSIILSSTFVIFVTFASVYASIFVVLTANFVLASALAGLSLARFVGGFWVK